MDNAVIEAMSDAQAPDPDHPLSDEELALLEVLARQIVAYECVADD